MFNCPANSNLQGSETAIDHSFAKGERLHKIQLIIFINIGKPNTVAEAALLLSMLSKSLSV